MFFRFLVTQKRYFKKFRSWKSYSILLLEIQRWKLLNLHSRTRDSFAGVSKHVIQEWIDSKWKYCESHQVFENKDPLPPIIAKSTIDVCQTDLVIMEKRPSKGHSNKTYICILNVMGVFSRCIFLKPLQSKESYEVASHLRKSWNSKCNSMWSW